MKYLYYINKLKKTKSWIKYWLINKTIKLPDGYVKLNYIKNISNSIIKTDITGNSEWFLKAQADNDDFNTQILLSKATTATNWFGRKNILWTLGGSSNFNFSSRKLSQISVKFEDKKISSIINGIYKERFEVTAPIVNEPYSFFGDNAFPFYGRLYSARCYQNNKLVGYFIPCKNVNNEVGLYDIISNSFYNNVGTGNLEWG